MHPQLQQIVDGFGSAQRRLHGLVDALPRERWATRPDPDRWSVAECIAHLNLTGAAYVPLIRTALDEARRLPPAAASPYRRDAVGALIGLMAGPLPEFGGVRLGRVRTTAPFVPSGDLPAAEVVATFDRLQGEQIALVREADGLAIDRVFVRSPFDSRLRYNTYSCLVILPRHQDRHLTQAEQVWQDVRAARHGAADAVGQGGQSRGVGTGWREPSRGRGVPRDTLSRRTGAVAHGASAALRVA